MHQRHGNPERECQIEFASYEAKNRSRAAGNYRPFDTVEIGASLLPIIGITRKLDRFVRFVRHELEGAGADRMLPHALRRHVAWINRRITGGKQRDKARL